MENSPRTGGKIGPWDIALAVFGNVEETYMLTLKADMFILNKIAEGFSTHSISLILGIPEKDVMNVSRIWGFLPVDTTLDFSPLYVYESGMSPLQIVSEINSILSIPITIHDAKKLIHNAERYYELLEFMREEERN